MLSRCGTLLTGSASRSKTGRRYWYYHCQRLCKERVRADSANEAFLARLKEVRIAPEVGELFTRIWGDLARETMAAQRQQAERLRSRRGIVEARLLKTDEAFIEGTIAPDSYARLKAKYAGELAALDAETEAVQLLDGAFIEKVRYGLGVLSRLDAVYQAAPVEGKSALVGSTFPDGLLFTAGDYRTSPPSELLWLLSIKNVGISAKEKTGHPRRLTLDVPSGGPDGTKKVRSVSFHFSRKRSFYAVFAVFEFE